MTIRTGAEVENDPNGVRLKMWGPSFDEFVILSVEQARSLAEALEDAADEVESKV